MNMPASSIRDLVVHEGDLVVGTHGRSIWILDNVTPLRELGQAASAERAHLFSPRTAIRVRWNMFSDTPLPPEEPTGENPPDGAILDYALRRPAEKVILELVDGQGTVIRRYSSTDSPDKIDPDTLPYPTYWFRPPQRLSTEPGHHRFIWDLRHEPPRGARRQFSIAAVYRNTPSGPRGPFVHPDRYTVRLHVDGAALERSIEVGMDPRVEISAEDLQLQTDLSLACYRGYLEVQELREAIDSAMQDRSASASAAELEAWTTLRGSGSPGDPDILYGSIYAASAAEETLVGLQHKFLFLLNVLQGADARPTSQAAAAVTKLQEMLPALRQRWEAIR
jgi:hypothetical protein